MTIIPIKPAASAQDEPILGFYPLALTGQNGERLYVPVTPSKKMVYDAIRDLYWRGEIALVDALSAEWGFAKREWQWADRKQPKENREP